jgi:hypothetical protein
MYAQSKNYEIANFLVIPTNQLLNSRDNGKHLDRSGTNYNTFVHTQQ